MHHYDPRTPGPAPQQRGRSKIDDLSWLGRDPGEQLLSLKVLLLLAVAVVPVAVMGLVRDAREAAVRWQVLVPADDAVVTIPTLEAGLDWQRLLVASFLAVAGLALAIGHAPTAEDRAE